MGETGARESLSPGLGERHMFSASPAFLQENRLINLNHQESPNLPGMAVELCVGFLRLAVMD